MVLFNGKIIIVVYRNGTKKSWINKKKSRRLCRSRHLIGDYKRMTGLAARRPPTMNKLMASLAAAAAVAAMSLQQPTDRLYEVMAPHDVP